MASSERVLRFYIALLQNCRVTRLQDGQSVVVGPVEHRSHSDRQKIRVLRRSK